MAQDWMPATLVAELRSFGWWKIASDAADMIESLVRELAMASG